MVRLILFGTFFIILTNKRQLDAAFELYGQSSGRIRPPQNLNDPLKTRIISGGQQYKLSHPPSFSPTFMQSRRFHVDQLARDNRDLRQPISFNSPLSSSYYYSYGGPGRNLAITSQEGCRLTNNYCSRDYQCCSGKCRCVKWSVMGRMSCWKKCY